MARRFRYLVDVSNRSTDNTLEAPQPDNQTAHNHGLSTIAWETLTIWQARVISLH